MSSHPVTVISFFVLLFVVISGYEQLAKRTVEKWFGVTVYVRTRRGGSGLWSIVGTKSMGQHLMIHGLHIVGGILALGLVFALTFGIDRLIVPLLGS